jgi:hypothetical protein
MLIQLAFDNNFILIGARFLKGMLKKTLHFVFVNIFFILKINVLLKPDRRQ